MKRCGLYLRVSTDKQVKIEEGSLKNQDHLLTQHIELRGKMNGDQIEFGRRPDDLTVGVLVKGTAKRAN